ncbi:MAG: hypothetical protein U1C33_00680 [Candidatus Cloacimonadaceae bacterium]|nr:hypothetical protein [Candidatus Cloacimonadaceae bacterium]
MKRILLISLFTMLCAMAMSVVISEWNFNDSSNSPNIGSGSLTLIGGLADDGFNTGYSVNPGLGWSTTTFPPQGTNNMTAGLLIEISSQGYNDISFQWVLRHSNTSPKRAVLLYTLDKTASEPVWVMGNSYDATGGDTWFPCSFDGSAISGMADNPNLAFKIVAAFSNPENTQYEASRSTSNYAVTGKWRWDDIMLSGTALMPHLEITSDLYPFYTNVGGFSTFQSYHIDAINLVSNLIITAPPQFMIRVLGETNFFPALEIVPRSSAIHKSIEIVYHPSVSGYHEGSIVHSGGGLAEPSYVNLTGSTTIPEPTMFPTGFGPLDISYFQAWLSWADSQGLILPDGYLIKGSKVGAAEIIDPVDGIPEEDKKLTKNVPYGIQTQLIFELNEDHTYYFKIFPYTNSGTAIDYKTGAEAPLISFSTTPGPAGSLLYPGDIAFVEYASDSPDRFSFVLLADLLENSKIYFTDKAWTGSAFADGEEVYLWRGVGRAWQKGEVIHIEEGILHPGEGIYNPDFEGFSNSGDQIIAFQGYLTEPIFVAAFSTTGWLDSGVPNNNSSYLPDALSLGINALGFASEIDNGVYNGTTSGTKNQLLHAINNPENWTRANSLSNITFPTWNIDVVSTLSSPSLTIAPISETTIRLAWEAIPFAETYSIYFCPNPRDDFPAGWQMLENGIADLSYDLPAASLPANTQFYRIIATAAD